MSIKALKPDQMPKDNPVRQMWDMPERVAAQDALTKWVWEGMKKLNLLDKSGEELGYDPTKVPAYALLGMTGDLLSRLMCSMMRGEGDGRLIDNPVDIEMLLNDFCEALKVSVRGNIELNRDEVPGRKH